MNTKFKLLLSYILVIIVIHSANVKAQSYFNSASGSPTPNTMGSSISSVLNTGNDAYQINGIGYEVSVWDGGSPKLGYHVNDGINSPTIGNVSLSYSDAVDPDVCLVQGNTAITAAIYALVVYHSATSNSGNGGFVFDVFKCSLTNPYTFSNVSTTDFFTQGSFGRTVNIDRNDIQHFAIVWDGSSGNVFLRNRICRCERAKS